VRIGHAVTLAPFCSASGFFYAQGLYIKCQYGNQFYQPLVDDKYRYSCAETVLFDGTTTTTTRDIPSATIMTDQSWQDDYFLDCVRTMPRPPSTPADVAPSSAPQPTAIASVAVNGSTTDDGDDTSKKQEVPLGLIVVVSVGAVLFIAIAGAVLVVLFCRKLPKAREAQHQQKKDLTRVQDATSSERDINDASHQTTRYHSGQGGGGGRYDDRHQGHYMAHAPAFTDPPAPYATVQVLPPEAIIDIPASARTDQDGTLSKSFRQLTNDHDVPRGGSGGGGDNRRASNGGDGGVDDRYRYSTSSPGQQQQDDAVTFKDHAQIMVVDRRPMAGNSIFAPSMMMAEERNNAPAASDSRRYVYQRPESTAPTTALQEEEEENDRPSTATLLSSGLSDAVNTRGSSSDPSRIIYPQNDNNGRHAAAASVGHYYDLEL
jgi:hypothetical protein